jgi:UDP-N-acetylglucosamine 2-epimerase (non-hydrolysing)
LAVAGTRPEILKLAPLIRSLRAPGSGFGAKTCFSGQHVEMLASVLGDLDVTPDVDMREPSVRRSLTENLAWLLERIDRAVSTLRPAGILVQGDTNTALAGATVAFHHQIPSFHVEAGLRTSDPALPFPEEMNRRLIARMAALHFAPTHLAQKNLLVEGVPADSIHLTGNTGIDALCLYANGTTAAAAEITGRFRPGSRRLLVTVHRRENAELVGEATSAMESVLEWFPDVEVLWILHLNRTRETVAERLRHHPRVHLVEPQSYKTFVQLMKGADLILSDSGGVQEEAPFLGKPVLVLRDETERGEAVEAGCARLTGCRQQAIERACTELLTDEVAYARMARPRHLFGDGHASARIVDALRKHYGVADRALTPPLGYFEGMEQDWSIVAGAAASAGGETRS